ncbi:hypothetical protein [Azospirillum picis]|uniref:Uncharacterized protein n=1 Tax=Azospirillum picis TaxID=488438 RepID=A0ABU0MP23_9PROT|nr:hypothetical protein [Azospirillum picis]MBP2301253.1 hypothetical protein [Azospirillum picis]MDQ0535084.1 hypothetical protein [Azospirillum picis]
MPPPRPPQPTRYAIQKARGQGWKTLEVGEDLPQARARFQQMVGVNPRAYFRLIQLDYNADSAYDGMEFTWTLIELHDPTRGRPPAKAAPAAVPRRTRAARPRKAKETVALPLRIYLAVILVGTLAGALAYLHFAGGR